jgi:predicted nucleotidyltransferase
MIISYSLRDETAKRFAVEIASSLPVLKIILFGSTARRDDQIKSDIDIAIIGEKNLSLTQKDQINETITNFLLDRGILINWIYILKNEWNLNLLPIVKSIRKEGIILWEKERI